VRSRFWGSKKCKGKLDFKESATLSKGKNREDLKVEKRGRDAPSEPIVRAERRMGMKNYQRPITGRRSLAPKKVPLRVLRWVIIGGMI